MTKRVWFKYRLLLVIVIIGCISLFLLQFSHVRWRNATEAQVTGLDNLTQARLHVALGYLSITRVAANDETFAQQDASAHLDRAAFALDDWLRGESTLIRMQGVPPEPHIKQQVTAYRDDIQVFQQLLLAAKQGEGSAKTLNTIELRTAFGALERRAKILEDQLYSRLRSVFVSQERRHIITFVSWTLVLSVLGATVHRATTAQQRASATLAEREERLRLLVESVKKHAFFMLDRSGRVVSWNKGAQQINGYTTDEIIGQPADLFFTEADLQKELHQQALNVAVQDGQWTDEGWRVRKDGSQFWAHVTLSVIRDTDGQVLGFAKLIHDVTERKQREALIEQQTETLRQQAQMIEQTHDAILVWELEGSIVLWNRGAQELYGFSAEQALGSVSHDLLNTHYSQGTSAFVTALHTTGQWEGQLEHTTRDGRQIIVESRRSLVPQDNGRLLVLESSRDVTERRRAEEALRTSEAQLSGIITSAMDAIITINDNQRIVLFNQAAEKMFGWPKNEVLGEHIDCLLPDHARVAHHQHVQTFAHSGSSARSMYALGSLTGARRDGSHFPIEASISSLIIQEQKLSTAVVRDITERKQAAEQLLAKEQFLRNVLDSMVSFVVVLAPDGALLEANRAILAAGGVEAAHVAGHHIADSYWWSHSPEAQVQLRDAIARAASGEHIRYDVELRVIDDQRIIVDFSLVPMRNAMGNITELIASAVDITARVQADHRVAALGERNAILAKLSFAINKLDISAGDALQQIVRQAVDVLGDACSVRLWDDHRQTLLPSACYHHDPNARIILNALMRATATPLTAGVAGQVATTGQGIVLPSLPSNWIHSMVKRELWPFVDQMGFHSAIAVPLRLGGHTIGVLAISRDKHQAPYSLDDQPLVQEVADRIALAINNVQLFNQAKDALQRTDEARALLDTLFASAPVGLAFVDCELRYQKINQSLADMNGHPQTEHLGKLVHEILPDLAPTLVPLWQNILATNIPVADIEITGITPATLDEQRHWLANYYPVRSSSGETLGLGVVITDITERKRTEEAIRQYVGRLQHLRKIDEAILTLQSPTMIAQSTVQFIREFLDCSRVSVVHINLDTLDTVALAVESIRQTQIPVGKIIHGGAAGWPPTVLQGDVLQYDDIMLIDQPPPHIKALQADGLRSCLVVPIMSHNHIVGTINIGSDHPHAFRTQHIEHLREVAGHLAIAFHNAELFEQVKTGRERLQTLSSRLVEIQEGERRHLARELHDEIGQVLTGVKLYLHGLQRVRSLEHMQESVSETVEIVEHALQQVRNLSLDLRPSMLDDFGLVSAVRWYGQRQAALGGFTFTMQGENEDRRYPTEIETTCFRIVQEALTNVVRHAGAKAVTVEVRELLSELRVFIRDDGHGFDVQRAQERAVRGGSLGLLGMQERAQLIGGNVYLQSTDEGTMVQVRVPRDTALTVERRHEGRLAE